MELSQWNVDNMKEIYKKLFHSLTVFLLKKNTNLFSVTADPSLRFSGYGLSQVNFVNILVETSGC